MHRVDSSKWGYLGLYRMCRGYMRCIEADGVPGVQGHGGRLSSSPAPVQPSSAQPRRALRLSPAPSSDGNRNSRRFQAGWEKNLRWEGGFPALWGGSRVGRVKPTRGSSASGQGCSGRGGFKPQRWL